MRVDLIDRTKDMDWQSPDDEMLPITKCVCGATFTPWEFTISIYQEHPYECENCKRKFYFQQVIKILEVVEIEI